jgi:disulfide bond formation protein DsbB
MCLSFDLLMLNALIMYISYRASRLFFFLFCHELIIAAYYFQFVDNLEPCPLCILQRVCFAFLALLFLIAGLHNPGHKGQLVYNILAFIPAATGVYVAGTHTWLQHLPKNEVPTCGPGLNYLLDTLPVTDALQQIFRGSGECADVSWRLYGFSMPEWTLAIFSGFTLMLGWMIWKGFKRRSLPW